jgi:hypothetical protein
MAPACDENAFVYMHGSPPGWRSRVLPVVPPADAVSVDEQLIEDPGGLIVEDCAT